jgi:MFS family permease
MVEYKGKLKKCLNMYINILLTLIFIGTCIIGMLQPIMADDYSYIANIQNKGFIEFFKSFYLIWSGRIINSFFMGLASVSNLSFVISGFIIGIVFILLVFFIIVCALGRFPRIYSDDRMLFTIAFAVMWFGAPVLGECVFWRSGAGSYLLPMFMGIIFIVPYILWYHNKRYRNSKLFNVLMLILGFMAGSSQEQVFVSIFVFAFIWFIFVRKYKMEIPNYLYFGLIGLIIGGLVLVLAPGNFARFSVAEHHSLLYKIAALGAYFGIYYFIVPIQQLWIWVLTILLIITVINLIENKEEKFNSYKLKVLNTKFYFWISIGLVTVLPMIFLASSVAARTCFFFITFLTIAFISLFDEYKTSISKFNESKIGIAVVFIVLNIVFVDVCIGVANGYLLSKEVKHRESVIIQNKSKGISEIEVAPLDVMPFHTSYIYDVKIDKEHAVNRVVSEYYNIKSIKLNHSLMNYRVEEDLDVVDAIKNHFNQKLK